MGHWAMYKRRGSPVVPSGVMILAAQDQGTDIVLFTFSSPIATSGTDWANLQVNGDNTGSVIGGNGPGDTTVEIGYGTSVNAGDPWQLVAAIPGLTFTGGTLGTPQDGLVTPG